MDRRPTLASFDTLTTSVRERLRQPLPGAEMQRRFSPRPIRQGWAPDLLPTHAKRAAVLVLLYPGAHGPSFALTVRRSNLAQHAGQISLPGGALDPGESPDAAALREAEEEIGIAAADVELLGALSSVWVAVSNFVIHPFVAAATDRPLFRADPREVEQLLETPVAHLLDPARLGEDRFERDGVLVDYPYFAFEGGRVWGATAIVLGEFRCLFEE